MKFPDVILWLLVLVGTCAASGSAELIGPLSPNEALKAFETELGFTVQLVAAEPLVIDPVALAFDERGRLYVAEDRDYPTGSADGRPVGRIALLEDLNGDGQMDRRTDFALDLKFPNGVMCWRGGVIVTASPDVWWLADTNGDGRADVKELLLTGFATDTTSQLRANDPTLGVDGWVYIAGGLRGGKVSSPKRPGVTVDTDKGDLRFKPDTGEMEIIAGKSQFGLAFDDAGNRFACMNRVQSQHAPLPLRALARNPLMVSPGALQNCPEIQDNTLMTRYTAGAARYYPISANITTADSHVGTYSAACAVHIYRGVALPQAYRGAAFSCDPTGNLVRGDRLEKTGGTFAARRIHEGTEALRSRDNWFRPVFLADGPDGALYVADMYRKTIEHPDYLPGEVRKHTDFESGKTEGRIWRLSGETRPPGRRARVRSLETNVTSLVSSLSAPTPWERETAFRLLVERPGDRAGARVLHAFRLEEAAGPAVMQLHLSALLRVLDDKTLIAALRHAQPAVRQNAVLLAEGRLKENAQLRKQVSTLAFDTDPHVRHQVALSLGSLTEQPGLDSAEEASLVGALAAIATHPETDRWTRAAVLSGLSNHTRALNFLETIGASQRRSSDQLLALAADLGRQLANEGKGSADTNAFGELWVRIKNTEPLKRIATLAGFSMVSGNTIRAMGAQPNNVLQPIMAQAREQALDGNLSIDQRRLAIDLLGYDSSVAIDPLLAGLLDPAHPPPLQQAAVRALFQPERADRLSPLLTVDRWNAFTPAVRTAILGRLTSRPDLAGLLMEALENGSVPIGAIMPAQREQMRKLNDPALRARAEKLLAAPGGNREGAFAEAKAALNLKASPQNGRAVFERICASCHRFNQAGVPVGPDLFDIRQQPKETILYHIIIPEAEIAPNFVNYECELKDGRLLSGLLVAETPSQITLRMAQGVEEIVSRNQIDRLSASRLSLMPQEMEKLMSLQEMADLLGYLRGEQ